jgi:mono/diheme cytochrome c family protein
MGEHASRAGIVRLTARLTWGTMTACLLAGCPAAGVGEVGKKSDANAAYTLPDGGAAPFAVPTTTTPAPGAMAGGTPAAADAGAGNGAGPVTMPVAPPAGPSPMPPPPAGVASDEMPTEVATLLRARCSGCHTYGLPDPAGWGSVLDVSRMIDADIIVPGSPDESRMIDRVSVAANMPPRGPRLTSEEVALLRNWISNLKRDASKPPSDDDILDMIAGDQLSIRGRSADYRYVSFAHYAGQGRPEGEMKTFRQALTFVINSLSRRGAIAELPTIDPQKSIFRIDLAELGWNARLWDDLTSFYPYCLRSDAVAHEALYLQLGTEAPVVRGDWLLATATKAPLYDLLLDLPATVDQLAARLGININDDINHPGQAEPDNLVRIGFRRSEVALHNRLVERHLGAAGQYLWITYDFDSSQGNQDLLSRPLGPANRDRQQFQNVFTNVAGEVIYTLPNGMQGYMVIDGAGRKVAAASNKVVRDPHRRDGIVTNGLSCFGCHAGPGLLRPRQMDEVPVFTDGHIAQFLGRELVEIEATYPRALKTDIFATDSTRYRSTVESAPGGAPPNVEGGYAGFITALGHYESNVGFHGAAADFNQDYDSLRATILANDSQNDSLPRSTKQPLVTREDFVCVWRDLVTKIRPNALFCDKTFEAAAVRNTCQ